MSRTAPAEAVWNPEPGAHRAWQGSALVGRGDEVWQRAARDVLRWAVKTRSGFAVPASGPVAMGERTVVTAGASSGAWRAAFPLLLVAQRIARRRYLRALR